MDKQSSTPDVGRLHLEDNEDVEDLFASPESGATTQKHTPNSQTSSAQEWSTRRSESRTRQTEQEAHEARLRAELDRVREINKVIENVTASLTKARANMATVHRTVDHASTLLATWTRILSQTEHNQRLILNPEWQGATKDLEDMEGEDARRQQEAERRAQEEARRREEEAQRKAEEEERRKAAAANPAPTQSSRGSGKTRGLRGSGSASRGYAGGGGQVGRGRGSTTGPSRAGSGIARTTSTRGRGRGLG